LKKIMKHLDLEFWAQAVGLLAGAFAENEVRLCGYDGAVGDGDHGTSMLLGFSQARKSVEERPPADIGHVFRQVGEAFMENVGGVTGVIVGSMFAAMGESTTGARELGTGDLSRAFSAGLTAMKKRGKAAEGDKSMVDALSPAVHAMAAAAEKGQTPDEALRDAAAAAAAGMEATSSMEAKVGRGRYQKDKTVGHVDAGAASISLVIEVLARAAQ
jgi:phosphoenolpyruvate---glycerone phosphotransferase subunit DhaL